VAAKSYSDRFGIFVNHRDGGKSTPRDEFGDEGRPSLFPDLLKISWVCNEPPSAHRQRSAVLLRDSVQKLFKSRSPWLDFSIKHLPCTKVYEVKQNFLNTG
jgi:hypothetical protein